MTEADPTEQFLHAVSETPEIWRSLDLRVFALRIDGAWHATVSRCVLDARDPDRVPRAADLPGVGPIAVWQERLPIADLRSLLEGVAAGEIRIGGERVLVRAPGDRLADGPVIRPSSVAGLPFQHVQFSQASPRLEWDRTQAPAHALVFTGPQGSAYLDRITGGRPGLEGALRGLERPWDGVDAVTRLGLGTRFRLESSVLAAFEVIAPLGATLIRESCALVGGSLRYELSASGEAVAKRVSLGYSAEEDSGRHRSGSLRPSRRAWRAQRPSTVGASTRRCIATARLDGTRQATLLLRVGPFVVDRVVVEERGPLGAGGVHLLAYGALDPELRALRTTLLPASLAQAKTAKRDFEHAVARLLSLAGFRADALGGFPGVQDAADVLATTPDGTSSLLVECTVGPLNTREGKPARLFERVDAVQRQLGRGARVLPVMATVRHGEAVAPSEREAAGRDGIVVLVREDLEQLLEKALRGAPPHEMMEFILGRVPVTTEARERVMDLARGWR